MSFSAHVTGTEDVASGKFIAFRQIAWEDAHGVARVWESAERLNEFRAVMIIPRLTPSGRIVLIKQFRPPARGWVVEFPAGILNPGEDPAVGAARELREETGYHAAKVEVHPAAFTSPGLSNEAVFVAIAEIDETETVNLHLTPEFDPGEMIEMIIVSPDELSAFYRRESAVGTLFDCKLVAYIMSLSY